MNTPIYDFVKKYASSQISRLHMPGHKGESFLGPEPFDITEVPGADSLYEASGIIHESEQNASSIFGTGATFYSTEGSSLSIKAMIYSALLGNEKKQCKKIAAVRNPHKSFINACALLDVDIEWIYPSNADSLCSGTITPKEIEEFFDLNPDVFALYITSPNYLGQTTDIKSISEICTRHSIPLLVDNAHGAYLKFCGMHPIDLGADMCCDSAHKTLPVLTGGAYLHVAVKSKNKYADFVKNAMSVFGSTSPSYLILASLDMCNSYLDNEYKNKLDDCIRSISSVKQYLFEKGFSVVSTEPLKLTVQTDGETLANHLRKNGVECEYYDKTALVLMVTPENTENDILKIREAFSSINSQPSPTAPPFPTAKKVLTVREALMSTYETVDISSAIGHVCASCCLSCPPAIPIAVCGELITEEVAEIFRFYGIEKINIIK